MSVVPLRAARARLLGLEDPEGHRALVAVVRIVVDNWVPRVVMHDGEPFVLYARHGTHSDLIYGQERAVRVDPGMVEEGAR